MSELLARRSWPNGNAIGKKIRYGDDWLTVIGVCGDIKHGALDESSVSMIYVPYPQVPAEVAQFVARDLNFVVRSSSPGAVASGLRGVIHAINPGMVVTVNTLEALIHDSTTQPRFRTWLIGIFSILALRLACLGIYGVIAYLVTQRYKEIGIRLALGATRANILSVAWAARSSSRSRALPPDCSPPFSSRASSTPSSSASPRTIRSPLSSCRWD